MSLTLWEVPACEKHGGEWHSDCEGCRNLTPEQVAKWYEGWGVIRVPKPKRIKVL